MLYSFTYTVYKPKWWESIVLFFIRRKYYLYDKYSYPRLTIKEWHGKKYFTEILSKKAMVDSI